MQKRKKRKISVTINITVWTDFMQGLYTSFIKGFVKAMESGAKQKGWKTEINYSITIDNEKTNTKNRPLKARQKQD